MNNVDEPSLEARKVEAECRKLDLESQLLEKTLRAKWWGTGKLLQYLVAVIVTATAGFFWFKGFAEPILRREGDINKLMVERNSEFNKLLEAKNGRLDDQGKQLAKEKQDLEQQMRQLKGRQDELQTQRDELTVKAAKSASESNRLRIDGKRLKAERDELDSRRITLEREESGLKTAIAGMRVAIDQVKVGKSEFFSILNSDDPITALRRQHGWKVYSDNYFYSLGYYLVISHPKVNDGKIIYVARESDIDRLKRDVGSAWQTYIAKVTAKAPLLVLDYSYLGLLAKADASTGGVLYLPEISRPVDFHAPLSDWEKELNKELVRR